MIAEILRVDDQKIAASLETIKNNLDSNGAEICLEFSSVPRLSSCDVVALDALAQAAQEKKGRVVLHHVNVEVYKTLKLARLASRFTFVS